MLRIQPLLAALFLTSIMLVNPAAADNDDCMAPQCSALEEQVHNELADYFADQIDAGWLGDDEEACENTSSFMSELRDWGIRAVLNGAAILIGIDDGTINDIIGTELADDIASAGITAIQVYHDDFVEEMRDRRECQ